MSKNTTKEAYCPSCGNPMIITTKTVEANGRVPAHYYTHARCERTGCRKTWTLRFIEYDMSLTPEEVEQQVIDDINYKAPRKPIDIEKLRETLFYDTKCMYVEEALDCAMPALVRYDPAAHIFEAFYPNRRTYSEFEYGKTFRMWENLPSYLETKTAKWRN